MSRKMLINAQTPEELRIAIVTGGSLENFQVEATERGLCRGNIYRGIVVNLQPSLNAAFIDFGAERHGFLSFHDVVPQAYHRRPREGRVRIEEVLERGKPILVQVSKDPEGQKGAALTTSISLPGRFLVLTPFDDTRGVSRKVEDEEMRKQLREQAEALKVPEGAGFIVRTNAIEQTKTTLNRDFTALLRLWKRIESDFAKERGTALLYDDQDIILRTLRDYLDASIDEVIIDDDDAFRKATEYVRVFLPRSRTRLTRYAERAPLFSRFGLEEQIDTIHDRTVPLPSGGSIVIDRTEALVAIDVNSGKATRASTQEETAVQTNVEAAREVARQLRLRDIGGLVVVDFIDMRNGKNRARVEKTLRDAMKDDRARSTVGKISRNGLLEVNRQRLQQALDLRTHRRCPTCSGTGRIASPEMVGLNLLRRIEARAATSSVERVRIELHPELADAFQNGRRHDLARLEREFEIRIEVIASNRLHRPEQVVEWFERSRDEQPRVQKKTETARTAWTGVFPPPTPAPAAREVVEKEPVQGEAARPGRKRRRGKQRPSHEPGTDAWVWTEHEAPREAAPAAGAAESEEEEPETAGIPEAAGEPGGETASRRKRRRRRKGRGHAGEPREAAEAAPAIAASDTQTGGEPEDEHPSDEEFGSAEPEAGEPDSAAAFEAVAGTAGRKKRRRRRRAKGGQQPHGEGPAAGEVAAGESPGSPETESNYEGVESAAAAAAEARKEDAVGASASDEEFAVATVQASATPARRRRRSRKKKNGNGAHSPAEEPASVSTVADRVDEPQEAAQAATEPTPPEEAPAPAVARKRRPRRPRPRARADERAEGVAEPDGDEQPPGDETM